MTPEEELNYLSDTDDLYGHLKGRIAGLEYRMKVEEARGVLAGQGSVELRKAQAKQSKEYLELVEEFENSSIDLHTIGAKRRTAELRIEVWRSQESSRRLK